MRAIKFALEALGLLLALGFFRLLPPETASNLGGFVGRTIGPRLGITRRAWRNLRLVFPDRPEPELAAIVREMWDNLGRVATEYPHLGHIADPKNGRVELVGVEPVIALRDRRTAGIIASAHLANWEVMPVVAAQNGVDATVIVREPNNPLVRPVLDRLRGVAGGGRTPKGAAGARAAVQVLREGRLLGLLFDQKMNSGLAVPLFGVPAMTAGAPAQLALRLGCPIIPVRIERLGPARFRMTGEKPLSLPNSGNREADAAAVTAELNRILERWILERPGQWLWLHKRWPEDAYRATEAATEPAAAAVRR